MRWLKSVNWIEDAILPVVILMLVLAGVGHFYSQASAAKEHAAAAARSGTRPTGPAPDGGGPPR